MSIDWSMAPEGFDYYLIGKSLTATGKVYMKVDSVQRYVSASGSFVAFEDALEFEVHLRPDSDQVWTGEGLPPVGTVCELKTIGAATFGVAEIMYSSESALVWRWKGLSDEFGSEWDNVQFRPIRTPEQIAADKRLHEIRNALTTIKAGQQQFPNDLVRGNITLSVVEAMIDAGYRMQVAQ